MTAAYLRLIIVSCSNLIFPFPGDLPTGVAAFRTKVPHVLSTLRALTLLGNFVRSAAKEDVTSVGGDYLCRALKEFPRWCVDFGYSPSLYLLSICHPCVFCLCVVLI